MKKRSAYPALPYVKWICAPLITNGSFESLVPRIAEITEPPIGGMIYIYVEFVG